MHVRWGAAVFGVSSLSLTGLHHRTTPPADPMCDCQQAPIPTPPAGSDLKGSIAPVHDPTMAKEGDTYYVFCTGPGIQVRSSLDRVRWNPPRKVLDPVPAWTATTVPGSREYYWAPDVTYFDHKWHLYYAVSTFGRNRSAIGLATNQTLDPSSPSYKWEDQGPVVQSYPTDGFNAIDPHIAMDEHSHPWLTFGSFWGGIKLVRLDTKTGKPADPTQPPIALAFRPKTLSPPDAIEAPFILRHGRFFYLFASYDFCCRGIRSTYNIRVGRSSQITGPYVDRDGVPMMEGGGTQVLAGGDRWKGPGHNCVMHDHGRDYLVYHAYDADANGIPTLRITELDWSRDGWPSLATPAPTSPRRSTSAAG